MPALFLVRAEVRRDLCEEFDRWYDAEHLPQAREVLGARAARRCWSATDPGVHVALYEFETLEQLAAKVPSADLQVLLDAFDEAWPEGVTRTREVLGTVQRL
ncbi:MULTISPECIES: hypothetical protein [unclassified Aeromicrobium]|uniref:hypothetical protein n=1 Tax=unclassified Aeromicrobium TaxID=2633570 RepID=UPI00288AE858|nr:MULTISPECIES: hypothetical protein [unclassified Aeromicrobium]